MSPNPVLLLVLLLELWAYAALCTNIVDANDDVAKINSSIDAIKNVRDILGNCIIIISKAHYRMHGY